MQYSMINVQKFALWGAFSLLAVKAQTDDLLPGDDSEAVWKPMGTVDPWYLPADVVDGGDKDGSVLQKATGNRIRCGVVGYDKEDNIWMIPANGNFDQVGYILPRGGYDSRSDKSIADCVLRESKEEGGLIIDINSLIPLGLSNGGAVYWYKGNVTETVEPTEPRPRPPKGFTVDDTRAELLKPPGKPAKKADMRQAFHNSATADESTRYELTFTAKEGSATGGSDYSVKDLGRWKAIYTDGFTNGEQAIVKVLCDIYGYRIVANEAWASQFPLGLSLTSVITQLWTATTLDINEVTSIKFSEIVDPATQTAISNARTELGESAGGFTTTNDLGETKGWNTLMASPYGVVASEVAKAAGKGIAGISVTDGNPSEILFTLEQ
ncbi:NUDIX domain-containing protein [Colletotrichum simmondsii]|uniref:NUDIX domain-containing protein n=2 Tax=Colletotrichum acutatum species complex TaxID=2707335 RepID=A0A135TP16_9PEZI|nr:NUDIX domain-containing protein [Colletotrichum simmondsii]